MTYNDAERTWRVYSDSATMRGAILKLAKQLGADVRPVEGHGVEFSCPGNALRLTARRRLKLSEEAREGRRVRLAGRRHPKGPLSPTAL